MIKIIREFATEDEAVAFLKVGDNRAAQTETILRERIHQLETENGELQTELQNLREKFNAYAATSGDSLRVEGLERLLVQKTEQVEELEGYLRVDAQKIDALERKIEELRSVEEAMLKQEETTVASFDWGDKKPEAEDAKSIPTPEESMEQLAAHTEHAVRTAEVANAIRGVELDAAGMPWDERIHSSTRSKLQNGNWKLKRGVDPDLVATVTHAQSVPTPTPEPTEEPNLVDAFAAAGDATPLDVVKLITQHRNSDKPLDVDAAFRRLGFVDASGNPFPLIELMNRPDLAPAVYKELTTCVS